MNWFKRPEHAPDITTSILYDENTFYQAFLDDLRKCKKEVIIESPFITSTRMNTFYPIFKRILDRGIKIYIITRDPVDHDETTRHQATNEILYAAELGVNAILLRGNHHRKLAIIDEKILWEGSLNILSQNNSMEFMRRVESKKMSEELIKFLELGKIMNKLFQ